MSCGEDDDPYDVYWDDDWDDDDLPIKEEPDCFSCNDYGCSACSHHHHCDCAACFDHIVDEYEIFDDPDREPAYAGPWPGADEFPF